MKIKFFADGANKATILQMNENPQIAGFTTNPTLMAKAGVRDYRTFARDVLDAVRDKPISFEVFSDELNEMKAQALEIASWGKNVFVKIPITNTRGEKTISLIRELTRAKVKLNVTAVTLVEQVQDALSALEPTLPAYISVFAGRIADCGVDPVPMMSESVRLAKEHPSTEIIWASTREVYNVVQAEFAGCQIITITDDVIKKLPLIGKDLGEMSLDTVRMFYNDAASAGFNIKIDNVATS